MYSRYILCVYLFFFMGNKPGTISHASKRQVPVDTDHVAGDHLNSEQLVHLQLNY